MVEWRTCNEEIAGSILGRGYFAPRSTQSYIPSGSINEYQLRLGRQRQAWLIPIADETQGVQVILCYPLTMRAIPMRCFVLRWYTNQHIPLPLWCSVHFSGLCGYCTTDVVCDQICWRWFVRLWVFMIRRPSCIHFSVCTIRTLLRWPSKSPRTWYPLLLTLSCVSPWPWPWGWSLALRVVLGLEGGPWPWGWSLALNAWYDFVFDTSHNDQNSLLHWCDGVCWQWHYVPTHGNGVRYLLTISAVYLICISFR